MVLSARVSLFVILCLTISCGEAPSNSRTSTYESVSENGDFPMTPSQVLSPGSVCEHPDEFRYPEQIPYCRRHVSGSMKWDVIHKYDDELGFRIEKTGRYQFKIDHLIPLCFGGSNNYTNLWPQHKMVYTMTDPLEHKLCGFLQRGQVTQERAIQMILRAKFDLNEVETVHDEIEDLNHNGSRVLVQVHADSEGNPIEADDSSSL